MLDFCLMDIIFTEDEIATAKAEWKPQLQEFAAVTNAMLRQSRRLPIYEQAVELASEWLQDALANRVHRRKNCTLVVAGDEHLHAAVSNVTLPDDSIFLYRPAWQRWWSGLHLSGVCWWQEITWAVNCPQWLLQLAESSHPELDDADAGSCGARNPPERSEEQQKWYWPIVLTPNQSFLCSEEIAGRGTHGILRVEEDGRLSAECVREWLAT